MDQALASELKWVTYGPHSVFWSAAEQAKLDPATLEQEEELAARHAAYHKRIVWISKICGGLAFALGAVLCVVTFATAKTGKDVKVSIMATFIFCA